MNVFKAWFPVIVVLLLSSIILTGCGGASSSSSSSPSSGTVPAAPAGVTATPGNTQATIAWTAVPGATSYDIYWFHAPGLAMANYSSIDGVTANPYIQLSLTDGSTYYYVVTAVNSAGQSAPSSEASCTLVTPAAPAGVTATSSGIGQVTVAWTAVPGALNYNIYWSTVNNFTLASVADTSKKEGVATTTNIVTGLTSGTPYFFVVTAVNDLGESAASSYVTATPQ